MDIDIDLGGMLRGHRSESRRLRWGEKCSPLGKVSGNGVAQRKMEFSLVMACFGKF